MIKIVRGDITQQTTAAIENAANIQSGWHEISTSRETGFAVLHAEASAVGWSLRQVSIRWSINARSNELSGNSGWSISYAIYDQPQNDELNEQIRGRRRKDAT